VSYWKDMRDDATKQREAERLAVVGMPRQCPLCTALPSQLERVGRDTGWWFCNGCGKTFRE